MHLLLRTRPFLIVASVLATMWIVAQFWEAPFHVDEVGATRLFGEAFDWLFIPARLLSLLLGLANLLPPRAGALVAVACYLGTFLLLDRVITRWIRGRLHEAP